MADLLSKLRMLDAEPKRAAPPPRPATASGGSYYHDQAVFPISLFGDREHIRPDVLESAFGCSFPPDTQPEDILFLDTETTGLSGGVGTVAFEVGIGYFAPTGFVVEQFLMHDYPEEAAMLSALNALMQRFPVLCTFNGRTFDVPLLRSRFLMNRISHPNLPQAHADVLFPARRLWKLRLKSCTLANLERQLLGVEREDDLPGALVPQTYFQYLKDGVFAPLKKVLEHNKQDIVSLAQLLSYLCKQVAQPQNVAYGEDLFSMARAMEKNGQMERAMHCYRLSAQTSMRADACAAMARIEKRNGHVEAAVKLYQSLLNQHSGAADACEALAKLYEHQLRDLPGAISYTRQALLILSEPTLFRDASVQDKQIALQYRYARLRRKLDAQSK